MDSRKDALAEDSEPTPAQAPELHYRSIFDGTIHFSGTREALIAAGVCRDDVFPGDPGDPRKINRRGARVGRFATTDPMGRLIHVTQINLGNKTRGFMVERSDLTPEERAESEAEERQYAEEREARERERSGSSLDDMEPDDVARMIDSFATTAIVHERAWRLCEEDRNRIVGLKLALVEAIRNASVIRSRGATVHHLRLVKG